MMCKFYHECEYASSAAFTCTAGGGGDYCGHYRILAATYKECNASKADPRLPGHARETVI
jgi:hypothetical protein